MLPDARMAEGQGSEDETSTSSLQEGTPTASTKNQRTFSKKRGAFKTWQAI